jgi:molecular chaperone GrpE
METTENNEEQAPSMKKDKKEAREEKRAEKAKDKELKSELKDLKQQLESSKKYISQLESSLSNAEERARDYDKMKTRSDDIESKLDQLRTYIKKIEEESVFVRERAKKDVQKNVEQEVSAILLRLLDIVDNFDRSVDLVKEESGSFVEGIRLIHDQFNAVLKATGLERLETKEVEFDPNLHEALTMMPAPTNELDGKIMEEVKAGYKYKDTLLRAAQVIVGKKSD